MEGLERKETKILGNQIKVYYNDGNKISRKDGRCTQIDDYKVELNESLLIPFGRIIRIEILGVRE